jgi:hypothetical protein
VGELVLHGPPEHAELNVYCLEVLGSGLRRDLLGSRPDLNDDRTLDNRNNKVGSLATNIGENTTLKVVEKNGAVTGVDLRWGRGGG